MRDRWKRVNILSRGAKQRLEEIQAEEQKEIFRCPFCLDTFETAAQVLRHKNRSHLGITPKECGFCVQETNVFGSQNHHFFGDDDMFHHVVEKHKHRLNSVAAQKAAGVFICPRCDAAFRKKLAFRVHVFEHHETDGPLRCKNSGCPLGFWTRADLDGHDCKFKPAGLKIRVISDAKCDDNQDSGYEDILYDHQPQQKDGSKVKIKEYNTRLEYNIRSRAMDVHTSHAHFITNFKSLKADNFECCECGSRFDTPEGLTSHLDQHEWAERGAPPATDPVGQCVMCSFTSDPGLDESEKYRQMADHVISEHFKAAWPTLNPPPLVRKAAPLPSQGRQNHDLDHDDIVEVPNPNKPSRSVCETCYKEFETEMMLRVHIKYAHSQHTETAKQLRQLNTCTRCNKTCTSESQLILHMSLYCDVSYSCDFCPSSFDQIKVLAVHVKAVHKGETVLVESSQQRPREQQRPPPAAKPDFPPASRPGVPCPYFKTDECYATFSDKSSREYSDHVTQHHIDHMKKHQERQMFRKRGEEFKQRVAAKRKAQEMDDGVDEVVVPVAAPLSTNSPFMADEIDGEQEEEENTAPSPGN